MPITEGLSYTVTPDLFGETRINLTGLTVEQVEGLFKAVNATIDDDERTSKHVLAELSDVLSYLFYGDEAAP